MMESTLSNACNAIRDGDRGERGAIIERIISNARNAIRDSDRSEGAATIESPISNARDVVGDGGILTASNKGICRFLDNCVAVLAAIVGGITSFYYHRGEGGAIIESLISNVRDAVGDGDRGERGAIIERPHKNTRHAFGNSHGSQREAIPERTHSNARDAIRDSDRGEGGATLESQPSNARDWTIEGDDSLAVLVGVAYDLCAEDIGFIWSDGIAIGGGIGDLPSWVDRLWTIFLDERSDAI